jgi:hypothetical protein
LPLSDSRSSAHRVDGLLPTANTDKTTISTAVVGQEPRLGDATRASTGFKETEAIVAIAGKPSPIQKQILVGDRRTKSPSPPQPVHRKLQLQITGILFPSQRMQMLL